MAQDKASAAGATELRSFMQSVLEDIRVLERMIEEGMIERDVRRILDDLVTTRRQAMSDPFATWIEALTATRLGLRSPAAVEQESPRATQVWVQTLLVHASSPQHWFAPNPVGQAIPRAMQLLHR